VSQVASTVIETSQATFDDASLPHGWRWVQLKEVCERIDYGFTASADFKATEPRFLRITDIQNGRVDWEQVPGCKINANEEAANRLADGDIVFARTGGTTGKSFLIRNPPRAVFASYLIRLRPTDDVDSDFLYGFFQSADYWKQIKASARGGAQPNVNATILGTLNFPLPPLPEQKRIAAIINGQLAAVERARAAAEAQLKAAKDLPAAFLRDAFDRPEAKQWERKPLRDYVLSYRNGFGRRPKELEVGAIVIRLADVSAGFINISNPRRGAMSPEEFSTYQLLPGDVLFVRVNGSSHLIGRCIPVNLNRNDLAYNDHLIRVRLRDGLEPNYLKAVCDLPEVRTEIVEKASTSAGQLTINQDVIATIRVPIAPIPEQQRIVSRLKEQNQTVSRTITAIQDQLNAINKLPAVMLRHAFTGKL
jgi:type I restriction enzyme S subunit